MSRQHKIELGIAIAAIVTGIVLTIATANGQMGPPYFMKQMNEHPTMPQVDLEKQSQYVEGIWWDENLYTPIVLPDSTMVCRQDVPGHLKCMVLPPGTILMFPTPKDD